MKKISFVLISILLIALVLSSCKKENKFEENSLPSIFKVDIPDAISNTSYLKTVNADDKVGGDEIYEYFRYFISINKGASEVVQEIIDGIYEYDIDQATSFSIESDKDGRIKNIKVIENSEYDGKKWMYQLNMTDALSEEDADHGLAMQIFWNENPVQGIAILKLYNINHYDSLEVWSHGIFRIDYSEAGEYGYEQSMIVSIGDLPLSANDIYAIKSMKMFVGRNGHIVDLYGNSTHPNATFFNSDKGFDWAFVASTNQVSGLGVAEIGLPPYSLDESSRTVLLDDYSIHNVFTNLITKWYFDENGVDIDSLTLATYLKYTDAPGFFNRDDFIGSGTSSSDSFDPLVSSIQELSPYNPITIANLKIEFKK